MAFYNAAQIQDTFCEIVIAGNDIPLGMLSSSSTAWKKFSVDIEMGLTDWTDDDDDDPSDEEIYISEESEYRKIARAFYIKGYMTFDFIDDLYCRIFAYNKSRKLLLP
jgi:hypothetical protein